MEKNSLAPTTMRLRKQILDPTLRKRGTKTLAGDSLL
jgi:predicted membrane GTPase involved in stress response